MKRFLPLFLLCAAVPATASADFVGFRLGVSLWGHDTTGGVSYGSGYNSLKDNLGLSGKTQVGVFASLEHPIPLLPNIALRYNNVSSSGDGSLTYQFGTSVNNLITPGVPVHTDLTLDQLDGILYYQLLDNVVRLDAGLDVKWIKGQVKMYEPAAPAVQLKRDFNGAIPMLYLSAGVGLPFTGLSAGVQGSGIAYGGNRLYDVTASVQYETSLRLGVAAGYRRENLKVKNLNDINIDTTVQGPFGSVYYHF